MNNNETTPYMSGVNAMFGGSNYLDVQLNAQNNPNTQINANYSTEKQWETSGTFVQNWANSDVHSAAGYNTPDTQNSNQNWNNQNINTGTTWVQNKVIDTTTQDNATKVLTAMINGEDVAYTDDKWVAIDMAKKRYNSLQWLIWMTDDALATYLDTADITLAHDLQKYYPERYASVMNNITKWKQLDSINQLASSLYNAYWWDSGRSWYWYTESKLDNWMTLVQTAFWDYLFNSWNDDKLQQIMDKYANYWQYAVDTYKTLMNTPEIRWYKNSIAKLSEQVNSLQEDINNIWDDVRERLWSSAPESLVSAYISQETKKLQKQLNSANIALSTAQTSYKMAAGEAEQLMDYYMKWYEYEMAAAEMWLKYSWASLVWNNWWGWWLTSSQIQKMIEEAQWNQPNYDLIAQDIIEWRFAWSTSADAMSRYWFISAVDDDELAAQVARALQYKWIDFNSISNFVTEEQLWKVQKAYRWLVKTNITNAISELYKKEWEWNYDSIADLLKELWADEEYTKDVISGAWLDSASGNSILANMWFDKVSLDRWRNLSTNLKNSETLNELVNNDWSVYYKLSDNAGDMTKDIVSASEWAANWEELDALLARIQWFDYWWYEEIVNRMRAEIDSNEAYRKKYKTEDWEYLIQKFSKDITKFPNKALGKEMAGDFTGDWKVTWKDRRYWIKNWLLSFLEKQWAKDLPDVTSWLVVTALNAYVDWHLEEIKENMLKYQWDTKKLTEYLDYIWLLNKLSVNALNEIAWTKIFK